VLGEGSGEPRDVARSARFLITSPGQKSKSRDLDRGLWLNLAWI